MSSPQPADQPEPQQTDESSAPAQSDAGPSRFNRRRALALTGAAGCGVAALAGTGYVGYRLGRPDEAETAAEDQATAAAVVGALTFDSRPDLAPPRVQVSGPLAGTDAGTEEPRYFFVTPAEVPEPERPAAGTGVMIVDGAGDLVWFSDLEEDAFDFRVQTYRGEPVLTWWQGKAGFGYGKGRGVIADAGYQQLATVEAVGDVPSDLHEFLITDRDTALLTIYKPTTADLSSVGGREKGKLLTSIVQEVDIASGELLFEWDSQDHVALEDSDAKLPEKDDDAYDYFHVNSIFEVSEDEVLISARNTHAIYSLTKSTGEVNWTLGGKNSDFHLADDAHFHFQHDARLVGPNQLMLFDNEAGPPAKAEQSRGMVLQLDHDKSTATLLRSYTHPTKLLADFMGSARPMAGGHVVVGWGSQPYFSVFSRDGKLLLDGKLPDNMMSYRITSHAWTGRPTEKPAITVGTGKVRGGTVYASWNGATDVAGWQVYAGKQRSDLSLIGDVAERTGFETAIGLNEPGPFYAVAALDADGNELARSDVVETKL